MEGDVPAGVARTGGIQQTDGSEAETHHRDWTLNHACDRPLYLFPVHSFDKHRVDDRGRLRFRTYIIYACQRQLFRCNRRLFNIYSLDIYLLSIRTSCCTGAGFANSSIGMAHCSIRLTGVAIHERFGELLNRYDTNL